MQGPIWIQLNRFRLGVYERLIDGPKLNLYIRLNLNQSLYTELGEQRFNPKPGKQAISKPNAKQSPRLQVKKLGSTKRP